MDSDPKHSTKLFLRFKDSKDNILVTKPQNHKFSGQRQKGEGNLQTTSSVWRNGPKHPFWEKLVEG